MRALVLLVGLALHGHFFAWVVGIWTDVGLAVASLSMVILPIIGGLLYLRRRELPVLKTLAAHPHPLGLGLMALAVVVSGLSWIPDWIFLAGVSLPLYLHGYLVWTRGPKTPGPVILPVYMLLFLVPWSYGQLSLLSEPLQVVSAQLATWIQLYLMDMPSFRMENVIHTGITTNRVVESCSGMATLTSLILYGLVFGYIFKLRPKDAFVLLLVLLPMSLLANGTRISFISYLLYHYGEEAANGPMHDGSGHVLFALSYGALFLLVLWMKKREKAQIAAASATQSSPSTL